MKFKTLRALALATLASTALVPAVAEARPGTKAEPLIVVPGADPFCGLQNTSATANLHQLFTAKIDPVTNARTDAAAKWGKDPLQSDWLYTWLYADGYNQCQPVVNQGRALYNKIVQKIAQWNAALPAGTPQPQKIDKVDLVGISLGSLVTRSCIANTGRGNPSNETPGCAALIDDWVGIVPPSHGSTSPETIACPWSNTSTCAAVNPISDFQMKVNEKYNGFIVNTLGAGDETPQAPAVNTGGSAIEYTTYWAGNDGLITPSGSEALWGADNVRVQSGAAGSAITQLQHNTITNPTLCPGSPAYTTPGTWEWLARALMDVGNHWSYPEESPRAYPTAIAPTSTLNCKSAPPELAQPVPAQPIN
ncbi:MAG: hypothetical protein Q7T55_24455 [Solirubrobacteraceae bacterium]|nr:hypothetical protein [Solirubrobacteraceae bacterium]